MNTTTTSAFQRPDYTDGSRQELLELVPTTVRKLLDIGCNRGAFGQGVKASSSVEVWGVEPDQAAAKVAQQRPDRVINGLFAAQNPIPEDDFDLVTFNDSFEHMPDPATALSLARRKLAATGRVHCCVPNLRHIENLEHLLHERDFRYDEFGVRDRTYLRFFTKKSIVRLFEDCGYRVVECRGVSEDWWDPRRYMRRVLFRLFADATQDMRYGRYLVVAERAQQSK